MFVWEFCSGCCFRGYCKVSCWAEPQVQIRPSRKIKNHQRTPKGGGKKEGGGAKPHTEISFRPPSPRYVLPPPYSISLSKSLRNSRNFPQVAEQLAVRVFADFFFCKVSAHFSESEKVFVSQERLSGFPEKGADLRGSPGNFRGSLGNFRGSLGNFRGTPGLLLSSTVRELPGKSPKNFRGSLGIFRGSPGTSQKLGVA